MEGIETSRINNTKRGLEGVFNLQKESKLSQSEFINAAEAIFLVAKILENVKPKFRTIVFNSVENLCKINESNEDSIESLNQKLIEARKRGEEAKQENIKKKGLFW